MYVLPGDISFPLRNLTFPTSFWILRRLERCGVCYDFLPRTWYVGFLSGISCERCLTYLSQKRNNELLKNSITYLQYPRANMSPTNLLHSYPTGSSAGSSSRRGHISSRCTTLTKCSLSLYSKRVQDTSVPQCSIAPSECINSISSVSCIASYLFGESVNNKN